ncbi:hypothetical protein EWM64_g3880 [Hericium alpestre]|uniref:Uncharacterized protein n=1 Tax=Hericium alpestre TaxID=135208 RepID=A0A4Y9ZZ13_9AGAM|nr:hypothetical protein EWM64_g3880 [Hericium alpestre]
MPSSMRFFARQSTNPDNNCSVLWFALAPGEECKVDILFPPTLNVPFTSEDGILWGDGLPVAPLFVHLLLKVQAWEHHRTSPRADYQAREPVDVADIGELLEIGKRDVDFGLAQEEWGAWPSQFMAKVRNFVWVYPESRGAWKDVGLEFDMVIYKRGVAYEP